MTSLREELNVTLTGTKGTTSMVFHKPTRLEMSTNVVMVLKISGCRPTEYSQTLISPEIAQQV